MVLARRRSSSPTRRKATVQGQVADAHPSVVSIAAGAPLSRSLSGGGPRGDAEHTSRWRSARSSARQLRDLTSSPFEAELRPFQSQCPASSSARYPVRRTTSAAPVTFEQPDKPDKSASVRDYEQDLVPASRALALFKQPRRAHQPRTPPPTPNGLNSQAAKGVSLSTGADSERGRVGALRHAP